MRRITKLVRTPVVLAIPEAYARTKAPLKRCPTSGALRAVSYERCPMSGSLLCLFLDDLVEPRHVCGIHTWAVNGRVVRFVRGQVDPLRRIGRRDFLIVQRARLLPQIPQVRLEPVDPFLALEGLAMA